MVDRRGIVNTNTKLGVTHIVCAQQTMMTIHGLTQVS